MSVALVIPAFEPPVSLVDLVEALAASPVSSGSVVDDGSSAGHAGIFDRLQSVPRVVVLRHAVNLGKGAALKTGITHALSAHPNDDGVVTADADGQHTAADVIGVVDALQRDPGALVLGARRFSSRVPMRSRAGNAVTRWALRIVSGQMLSDTQTGLRGIPRGLAAEMTRVTASGYEFELDMLIAAKHLNYPVREVAIDAIYLDGNRGSHFNPVFDSMRIYFVLLRFSLVSLSTAAIDNAMFVTIFGLTGTIWQAQAVGRLTGALFNYPMARRAVFLSQREVWSTLPKYLLLVAASGAMSYALLRGLMAWSGLPALWAKILAESLLFPVSFVIQRDVIFVAPRPGAQADRS